MTSSLTIDSSTLTIKGSTLKAIQQFTASPDDCEDVKTIYFTNLLISDTSDSSLNQLPLNTDSTAKIVKNGEDYYLYVTNSDDFLVYNISGDDQFIVSTKQVEACASPEAQPTIKTGIQPLTPQPSNLVSLSESKEKQMEIINTQLSNKQSELASFKSQKETKTSQLNTTNAAIATLESEKKDLETSIKTAMLDANATLDIESLRHLAEIYTQLNLNQNTIITLKAEIENLDAEIGRLSKTIQALEQNQKKLNPSSGS